MPLILTYRDKSVNFGSIFCAPGARGFYGEGYPAHRWLAYLGLTWQGTTFAAKTVTLHEHEGNMPLQFDGVTPQELFPRCIIVEPITGHVLNAVGLSNRGVQFYINGGHWSTFKEPFCLSFMAISASKQLRLQETTEFVQKTRTFFWTLRTPVALQINFACLNIGVYHDDLASESLETLDIVSELGIPIILNFNALVPIDTLRAISNHKTLSALWIANTIPWGHPWIDWVGIFGSSVSPLITRGYNQSGGLSGSYCLPITVAKVQEIRKAGIASPIIAGNGIQKAQDVEQLKRAGANAIAIGCVALVRPYRMRSIIKAAHYYLS